MRHYLSTFLLLGLLLVLALRLTVTETVYESLSQRLARMAPESAGIFAPTPEPGHETTIGLAALTFLMAGGATFWGKNSKASYVRLGLIGVLLGLGLMGTFRAANPMLALTGLCDMGMGLVGGWAVGRLATTPQRKQLVFAVLVAVLAAWVTQGLYQKFVVNPETIAFYEQNREEFWKQRGWQEGDPNIRLYEARLHSGEVTGFITFGNNLAEALLPMILVAGTLAYLGLSPRFKASEETVPVAVQKGASRKETALVVEPTVAQRRPLQIGLAVMVILLALGGGAVLVFTGSNGGMASGLLSAGVLGAGLILAKWVYQQRRKLVMAAVGLALLGAVAVMVYGLRTGGLPTKSLLFRWQYWTATAQMIKEQPWLGVGLHNFGYYYTQFKLPQAPEDVKDPHGLFLRVTAECGMPAMVVLVVLVGWQFLCALYFFVPGGRREEEDVRAFPVEMPKSGKEKKAGRGKSSNAAGQAGSGPMQAELGYPVLSLRAIAFGGALFCLVWWVVRVLMAEETSNAYFWILNLWFGVLAYCFFMLVMGSFQLIPAKAQKQATGRVALAGVAGCAAMLLYDQINMALLTGPVAMLFWALLGAGEPMADENGNSGQGKRFGAQSHGAAYVVGSTLVLCGLAVGLGVWVPLLQERFAWDSRVPEREALQAMGQRQTLAVIQAFEKARALDQRAIDLRRTIVRFKQAAGLSTREDIEQILTINHRDPRVCRDLALAPSDLPLERRIELLEDALRLDGMLPVDEIKRLTPAERGAMEKQIAEWRGMK